MAGTVYDDVFARIETRSPIRETERPMAVWIHVQDAVVGKPPIVLLGLDRGEPPVEGQSRQSIARVIEVKASRLTLMVLYCTGLVSPKVSESTNGVDSRNR